MQSVQNNIAANQVLLLETDILTAYNHIRLYAFKLARAIDSRNTYINTHHYKNIDSSTSLDINKFSDHLLVSEQVLKLFPDIPVNSDEDSISINDKDSIFDEINKSSKSPQTELINAALNSNEHDRMREHMNSRRKKMSLPSIPESNIKYSSPQEMINSQSNDFTREEKNTDKIDVEKQVKYLLEQIEINKKLDDDNLNTASDILDKITTPMDVKKLNDEWETPVPICPFASLTGEQQRKKEIEIFKQAEKNVQELGLEGVEELHKEADRLVNIFINGN